MSPEIAPEAQYRMTFPESGSVSTRLIAGLGGAAAAAGLGAGLYFGVFAGNGNHANRLAGDGEQSLSCDINSVGNFGHPTDTHGANLPYADGAFFPRNSVSGPSDIPKALSGWFHSGPLAGGSHDTDPASLAVMEAVLTLPSHDGEAVNPNFPVMAKFIEKLATYQVDHNVKQAQADCQLTAETIAKTVGYSDNFAGKSDSLVQVVPVYDGDRIVDIELSQVVSTQPLTGIEFKIQNNQGENLDGFNEFLVTDEGKVYYKGLVPQPTAGSKGPNAVQPSETGAPVTTETSQPQPNASQSQQQQTSGPSKPGSVKGVGGTVGPTPGKPLSFGTLPGSGEQTGKPTIPEQGAGAGTTPAPSPSPTSTEITPSRPVITVTVTAPETHPVTTPATTPPETHPATTPETTPPATTPVYKGTAPCNPVAQDCAKAEGGIASPVAIEVLGGLVAFGAATGAVVEKRRKSSVQPKHR